MECLEHHARQLDSQLLQARREEALLAASKDVRALSDSLGLKVNQDSRELTSTKLKKLSSDLIIAAIALIRCT